MNASAVDPISTDLLSDVLDALRVDSSALSVFEFSAPWGVRIADFNRPFSWTVIEGSFQLECPNREPMLFNAGDTFVLPRGTNNAVFTAVSSPGVPLVSAADVWEGNRVPTFRPGLRLGGPLHLRWGGGGALTRIISTAFSSEDRASDPLLEALPDVITVLADEAGSDFVNLLLRFPYRGQDEPGFAALATQTTRLLLVHVVRTYALSSGGRHGWLGGLKDPRIAQALGFIHRDPARNWSVAELATQAGMSRSLFADRFVAAVGQTPMGYLRAWRMHLAREALISGTASVTALAHDLGYNSEAAFREAFRKETGQQPLQFRRLFKSQ